MIERAIRFVNGVSFHRGMALGALVGAAIAGSTIWSRLRATRADPRSLEVESTKG
jgi:hypothetical protein